MSKRFIRRYLKNLVILGGGSAAFFGLLLLVHIHSAQILKITPFVIAVAVPLAVVALITASELDSEDGKGPHPRFPR